MNGIERHVPVLADEVLSYIPESATLFVDGTLGDGGHTEYILQHRPLIERAFAFDRDKHAIGRAQDLLQKNKKPISYFVSSFEFIPDVLREQGVHQVDAIVLDLGFSSPQLFSQRGFSFKDNAPLDMRYDLSQELTAEHIVNNWSKDDIENTLRDFGEERNARGLAEAIAQSRKDRPIRTTHDLVEVILAWYRKKLHSTKDVPWIGGIHPATRTFQALRIAVNDELGTLSRSLPKLISILAQSGRIIVITFHSGEDTLVKHFFKHESRGCLCPPEYPKCVCHHSPSLSIITKKPVGPTPAEIERNPKSHSARLRVAEKI